MRRLIVLLCLFALPAFADKPELQLIGLQLLSKDKTQTANQGTDLWTFGVKLTNHHDQAVKLTNNNFLLEEESGERHTVTRWRYPEGVFLEPGKSAELDRIYFELPKTARPKRLLVFKALRVVGATPIP